MHGSNVSFELTWLFFLQFTESDAASGGPEELPAQWNSNAQTYSLKYRSRNGSLKVLIKGIVVGEIFIVSAAVRLLSIFVYSPFSHLFYTVNCSH